MPNDNSKLNELVNALPEFYQPIYGHSEWDDKPLRSCTDRLPVIKKVYDALSQKLQRPLRVLDLGCAQGFFSLHISSWGGITTSVDLKKQNVELGEFLASENPDYKIKFVRDKIENFLVNVAPDEYDLVLGLSVLHNVSRQIGLEKVLNLIKDFSQKVTAGIFEFALEKVHNPYIPEDYHDFLPGFSFIRDLSYSSHRSGSNITRPLCFASDRYAYFESLGMLKIDFISYNVHPYLAKTDVMHFHCGDKFVKFFNINPKLRIAKIQQSKADQEIQTLKELGGQNGLPKLLDTLEESYKNNKRIFIVRERFEGVTVAEKLASGEEFDRWNVVKQALQWMVFLEERGYWHGDARPQNFLYTTDEKVYPIDYEEIRQKPIVNIWPYKVSLLFLMFMNIVLKHRQNDDTPIIDGLRLLTPLKRYLSKKQYEQILKLEDSEHFFSNLYEILFETSQKPNYTMADLEFLSIIRYFSDNLKKNNSEVKKMNLQTQELSSRIDSLTETLAEQQKIIEQLEKIVKGNND